MQDVDRDPRSLKMLSTLESNSNFHLGIKFKSPPLNQIYIPQNCYTVVPQNCYITNGLSKLLHHKWSLKIATSQVVPPNCYITINATRGNSCNVRDTRNKQT